MVLCYVNMHMFLYLFNAKVMHFSTHFVTVMPLFRLRKKNKILRFLQSHGDRAGQ